MRSQGDGTCLLGECKASYQCDCLGYEVCKRKKCAMYTALQDVVPSAFVPFGCQLTPDAGSCTTFDKVMDTIDSIENALLADNIQHHELMRKRKEAYEMVAAIEQDSVAVHDALKSLEPRWNDVSPEERMELEKDSSVVMELILESGRSAFDVSLMANAVYKGSRKVSELRATVVRSNELMNQAIQKLAKGQEEERTENTPCITCAQLQEDIKKFEKEIKDASKLAGETARRNREQNHKAIEDVKKIEEQRSTSAEAKERVLGKVSSVLLRVRNHSTI